MLACGVIAILSAFWAMRSRRRAALWCLAGMVPTFFAWLADASMYSLWSDVALAAIAVSVSLLAPGIFWLVTYKFRWPEILQQGFWGWRRNLSLAGATFMILVAIMYGSLYCALRMPRSVPYRCSSTSVLTSPLSSDHVMFLAHPLFPHPRPNIIQDYFDVRWPLWTLAEVDHVYWGLPWWNHRIVAVGYLASQSQFLFDGERDNGLISGMIPLYNLRVCGQTAEEGRAEAQLRILREGSPKSGVRIIGRVNADNRSGIQVTISSPTGIVHATTDQFGVYDVKGLPAGLYRIQLNSTDERDHRTDYECGDKDGHQVSEGEVWGCRLYMYQLISK
jgi:uncharacterized membrane protein